MAAGQRAIGAEGECMTRHEQGLVLTTLVMLIISSDELLIQVVIHEAPSRWALTGVIVVEITLFL